MKRRFLPLLLTMVILLTLLPVSALAEGETVNAAPAIAEGVTNPAAAQVQVNSAYTLDLSAIFEDTDGDTLTYQVSINSGPAVTADESYSYTPDTSGDYILVFTAGDAEETSPAYTVMLTVTAAAENTPPAIAEGVTNPAAAQVEVNSAYTLDLSAIFEDADGDILTYQVSINSGPAVTADESYSYTPDTSGDYTLVFTAGDAVETSPAYTVMLTATAAVVNAAPDNGTYELTFRIAPAASSVAFYATTGYDADDCDLYDAGAPLTAVDGGAEGGYHIYTVKVPNTVLTISFRGTDGSGHALGGMTVDTDDATNGVITLRQTDLCVRTLVNGAFPTADQVRFVIRDADYHAASSGETYVDDTNGFTWFRYLLFAGGNAELYTYYAVPQGQLAQTYGITTATNKTVMVDLSVAAVYLTISPLNAYTITVPDGATVQIFNQIRNFYTVEIEETGHAANGDGTTSHLYNLSGGSGLTYRVSMPGQITKAGYLSGTLAGGAMTVSWTDSDASPDTRVNNVDKQTLADRLEESVLLNVNSQNCLELGVGETYRLRAYRIWQIIDSDTANIMIEPDFHYNVISGGGVVSINPVTEGNGNAAGNWLDITAQSEGTAIIEIGYDAIDIGGSTTYTGTYAATDPQRTGLLIIQVGSTGTANIDFGIGAWDAEYDTLYFNGVSGTFSLTPSASGEITSVEILNNPTTSSAWATLTEEEGVYTATITPGNNILRVTSGSLVKYQVIRGASVTTIVENVTSPGGPIHTDDTVSVSFDGLYIPMPKFSGIYNPGYMDGHRITYALPAAATLLSTQAEQYDFITHHEVELKFGAEGTYKLTGGHVAFNVMGVANPIGGHRTLSDGGVGANFSAVDTDHVRCVLPDIEFTIIELEGPTPVFKQNITGVNKSYKVGETAAALQVAVSVADQGTLTYQWYVKTDGGEFEPITGAESNSYRPATKNEGTYSYKVIVTNTYDGKAYTAESSEACIVVTKASGKDITHTTSYYPTTGLSFNMNGKAIAGYVTVSVVDYGIRIKNEKVDIDTTLGVLISPTQVPYASGDTIATVTLRLLDALNINYSHQGTDLSGFYLECIKEFYVSDGTFIDILGEFDSGQGSGWMITWNNWFINMGASEFEVEDGDIIKWQYTCQLGKDIRCSMDSPSAEITGINFESNYGTLSPSFSTSTTNYTYTIPASVKSIRLEATQDNYWAQLIYTSGGKTYKPLQAIPVSDGTVITLDCNYYNDYTQKEASLQDSDKVTITIKVANENDASITPSVTASGGTANVSITSTQMTEAINKVKKSGGGIIIAPEITGAADTVRIELPEASVSDMASQTQADLVISTPVGSMTIPNSALASIASQASGGTVEISLGTVDTSKLTPAEKKAVGNHTVYDLSITSGGQSITSFDGAGLTLSLPYTLGEGEDPADVKVWYLNDDGELTEMSCTYNAATGMASFTTDHLSCYAVGYAAVAAAAGIWENLFTDVAADKWFYEAVEFVCSKELFTGTSDTTFSPDMPMTRAMLVTVLYRFEGEPAVSGEDSFTDVKKGQLYTNAVLWASGNSIVAGYGDGRFGINDKVTREQLATILYRYAKYKGYDVSASASLSGYADAGNIRDWASRAIKWAVAEELITGVTATALEPGASATRAQVATIFMRFVENIAE